MDVYSNVLFLKEVESDDTGANSKIDFCFNSHRTMPPKITVLDAGFDNVVVNTKYDKESNVSSLYEYSDSLALNKEEFNKKIKQILYNGYPINGTNFNSSTEAISLSAFRKTTQTAIWQYTDGENNLDINIVVNSYRYPIKEKNMLRRLLEATTKAPTNFVVDFYKAYTEGMQNIISGRMANNVVPKEINTDEISNDSNRYENLGTSNPKKQLPKTDAKACNKLIFFATTAYNNCSNL